MLFVDISKAPFGHLPDGFPPSRGHNLRFPFNKKKAFLSLIVPEIILSPQTRWKFFFSLFFSDSAYKREKKIGIKYHFSFLVRFVVL